MINLDKVCEGLDYVILDTETINKNQVWLVKHLVGEHKDVVMQIYNVKIDGTAGTLTFNVDSRKDDQEYKQSEEYLSLAGDIIEDIVKTQISNGSMVIDGQDSGE